ncbi:WW domain-binding protein 4 isoform X3 [Stegostoma tigrinum]|uniref:WW domain-binding protein 4 isoform X3 n=1 Tax=Stegostoma tigrinum TaxID=3053191 RepID=UPI00202B421C|nr:WW domain-binding protein 4 isoform X3 [Stegostoma tigrinum]
MADYWKSQPKKLCDYCKCWIADNKPSIEFHERGKNHQENVAKRISEIKKKSLDKAKEEDRKAKQFAEMESAAMKAYQEDLKRLGVNVSASSSSSTTEQTSVVKASDTQCAKQNTANIWVQGVSPEGYFYYYNTKTGESRWEKPEGFTSASECSATVVKNETEPEISSATFSSEEPTSLKMTETASESHQAAEEFLQTTDTEPSEPRQEANPSVQQESASGDGSEVKAPGKMHDAEDENNLPQLESQQEAKRRKVNPYGEWETVKEEEEEQIDLQLPTVDCSATPAVDVKHEPKVKFKQKEITSLRDDAGGDTVFKKRKLENGKSRNLRQKGNDN